MAGKVDNTTPHLAAVYDEQISMTIPYYHCFHDETVNAVKAAAVEPGLWLDTGCGTGTLVRKCLNVFPNTTFFLVDPSGEMMLQAKRKLDADAAGRVRFLEPAATQQLDLKPDLHFDVVTAIQCHHYLSKEDRLAATRVCYHALNRGGIFITFENVRPLTAAGIEIGKQNWANYQISSGKESNQVKKHLERFDVEYFPITIEEHLELYRGCGFTAVEILWLSCMQAGFYCIK
jgi:tRNA (cmo5U34)-methyltransferase